MVDRRILCASGLILLALITGGIGTFLLFILPEIVRNRINEQTHLGYNSTGAYTDVTQKWIAPLYNISTNIWTYSVTNPERVVIGEKPIIVEKGPYSFRQIQRKDVKFVNNNTRVYYRNKNYYFFDANASCSNCNLKDIITVPNLVLQNIIDVVKDNIFARSVFDAVLKKTGEKVFVTVSVGEFLFDGYADPLISKWCEGTMKPFCDVLKIPDRIGLFYKKNGTDDGKYEIGTGKERADQIGKMYSFNDKQTVNAWYGPYAKMVNGTDGQMFPPGMDQRDSSIIQIFIGQLCRTLEMEYFDKQNHENVPVYLYKPAKSMNNIDRQRELGFCNPKTPIYFNNTYIQSKDCLPSGLMDASSCLPGNPKIYMSQPHFYGSSAALADSLIGMRNASMENDGTVLGVEPATGVVAFAEQRNQINLGVINGGLLNLKNLSPRIIPLIWFNVSVNFDPATRDQLLELSHIRSRTFIAGIVSFVIFTSLLIGIISLLVLYRLREQSTEFGHRLLLSEEDEIEPPTSHVNEVVVDQATVVLVHP